MFDRLDRPFFRPLSIFFSVTSLRNRPSALAAGGGGGGGAPGGDPEATGGAAGLGLGPDAQAEEVLGREEVKNYLKSVKVRRTDVFILRLIAGFSAGKGASIDSTYVHTYNVVLEQLRDVVWGVWSLRYPRGFCAKAP